MPSPAFISLDHAPIAGEMTSRVPASQPPLRAVKVRWPNAGRRMLSLRCRMTRPVEVRRFDYWRTEALDQITAALFRRRRRDHRPTLIGFGLFSSARDYRRGAISHDRRSVSQHKKRRVQASAIPSSIRRFLLTERGAIGDNMAYVSLGGWEYRPTLAE